MPTNRKNEIINKRRISWANKTKKEQDKRLEMSEKTCLKRYGVKNPFQSTELMKNVTYQRKQYTLPSGRTVSIQGYEPYALDILLNQYEEDDLLINDMDIKNYIGVIKYNNGHIY